MGARGRVREQGDDDAGNARRGAGRARNGLQLAELEAVTASLLIRDRQSGAAELAIELSDHLGRLRALLKRRPPEADRRRLLVTTAETALIAGHTAFVLGSRTDAGSHLEVALRLARELKHRELQAAAMARQAEFFYSGRYGLRAQDARALRLVDEAIQVAGPRADPQLRAALRTSRAEQFAALGNPMGCFLDLDHARELMLRLGPFCPGILPVSTPVELEAVRGNCGIMLADACHLEAGRAVETLGRVLSEMPAEQGPWRATVLADQGAAYALRGDADVAVATLTAAMGLTEEVGARHNLWRIAGHRRRHLRGSDLPALRELDERLATAP